MLDEVTAVINYSILICEVVSFNMDIFGNTDKKQIKTTAILAWSLNILVDFFSLFSFEYVYVYIIHIYLLCIYVILHKWDHIVPTIL